MTPDDLWRDSYRRQMAWARAELADCRRPRLPVMARFFQQQMVRAYLVLRMERKAQ